jgi:hypothetical protein
MPSGPGLVEALPGDVLGNEDVGTGVMASLFESYAAACRTGAEVDAGSDAGSDAAFQVRPLRRCRCQQTLPCCHVSYHP